MKPIQVEHKSGWIGYIIAIQSGAYGSNTAAIVVWQENGKIEICQFINLTVTDIGLLGLSLEIPEIT